MRILVTGGTGLVGRRLVPRLRERGDEPIVLTRRPAAARGLLGRDCHVLESDPMQPGKWQDAVADCDAVIHLAGENVFARRWNAEFKSRLRDSRVRSTEHVVAALARSPRTADGRARVLVNASAIGYYGPRDDEELGEDAPPGDDFLAGLCVAWEQAARAAEPSGVRVAIVRVGVVLDPDGGALAQLLTPFKFGVGGKVGSGRQWVSWIHHEDLAGLLLLALDHPEARGPLNGTAPNPVTNYDFTKAVGRALHRPTVFPIPAFALRIKLGGVADVIATGQRVVPRKPLRLGYSYRFPTIDEALADVLK